MVLARECGCATEGFLRSGGFLEGFVDFSDGVLVETHFWGPDCVIDRQEGSGLR
jgi:hypothetical protein